MSSTLKVCIDIDGTICKIKAAAESYKDVLPLPGAIETIQRLKKEGYYIILHTARHMKTCDSNVGQVIARQGKTLLDWLSENGIEYDEIWFGKPYAHFYVDDNAVRFNGDWNHIYHQITSSKEHE